MDRGEVWWGYFPPPIGTRPALLLSRSRAYNVRASVSVALITTTVRGIRVEVPLGPEDGMPRRCVVNGDEVHTIPITMLDNYETKLSLAKMDAVADAIRYALDMEC